MRRKLSAIEHMIDSNIVYFVRLEGSIDATRLRHALSCVQRKHPALRTLIRTECTTKRTALRRCRCECLRGWRRASSGANASGN
jgi:hypothetical protein